MSVERKSLSTHLSLAVALAGVVEIGAGCQAPPSMTKTESQQARIQGCEVKLDSERPFTGDELAPLVQDPDCFGELNSDGMTVAEAYHFYLDNLKGIPAHYRDSNKDHDGVLITSLDKAYTLSGLGMLMASNCLFPNNEVTKGMDGQRVHIGALLSSNEGREEYLEPLPKVKVRTGKGVTVNKLDDGRIILDNPGDIWMNWSDYSDKSCITDENGNVMPRPRNAEDDQPGGPVSPGEFFGPFMD